MLCPYGLTSNVETGLNAFLTLPRLATSLSYFISELLCVPESQLDNVREIPLYVATVPIHEPPYGSPEPEPPPTKRPCLLIEEEAVVNLLRQAEGWVLDVDLDFFSTGNPYRGPFSAVSQLMAAIVFIVYIAWLSSVTVRVGCLLN